MTNVISFNKKGVGKNRKQNQPVTKKSGNTLCKSGFHKWVADKNTDFAVKEGKLFTRYACERCGKTRTEWR